MFQLGRFVFVAAAFSIGAAVASSAIGQTTDRYLPSTLPPPPSASPPAGVSAPASGVGGAPSTAAGQLRLVGPDAPASVGGAGGQAAPTSSFAIPEPRPARSGGGDPTAPGPDMRTLLGEGNTNNRNAGPPPLPEIRIRGRIFRRDKPPVAIVEVGGKQLTIRKGSEIQLPLPGGSAVMLHVSELNATELHIDIVDRKQKIILN